MSDDFVKGPGYGKDPKRKKRKNVMKEFVMDEISAVDFGAQEPAIAVLMKRRPTTDGLVEKLIALTSSDNGHQHAIHLGRYEWKEGGGQTSYQGEGSEEFDNHSHPFVINDDGTVTIGEANGHTHTVDLAATIQRLRLETVVHSDVNVVEMRSPLVKRERDMDFTARDYALVEDPNQPETWKYRLARRPGGDPNRREVGNAVKALERGEVPVSKRTSVMRRVRAAWLTCHKRSPVTQMPPVLKRVSQ